MVLGGSTAEARQTEEATDGPGGGDPPSDSPSANGDATTWMGLRIGPILMILAGLSFTLMVSFVKVARSELSVLDVVFWRGAVALPVAMLWAARVSWKPVNGKILALRVMLGFGAMFCYFFAARELDITLLSLLGKLQPLVIAVLAPLFLGRSERSGPIVWVLLGLGLVGTLILLGPDIQAGGAHGLAAVGALGATVFSGLAHLCIRKLTATDSPAVIVLYFQGFITVAAGIILLATSSITIPPMHLWGPLAGVGLLAFSGQILMTWAYRSDKASVVATAGYTTPVWAVLADIIAFGVVPGWHAFLGGAIVVAAGVFLVLRRR